MARAYSQTGSWQNLFIRPRWHRLIVGPTGTGKTHLASALAQRLGWPLLSLTVPDWILLGCNERGAKQTWRRVAEWLSMRDSFALIFVDEVDKISGDDTWSRHLRTEVFDLLDGRVPTGLRIADDGAEDAENARLYLRAAAQLHSQTLILGASAFQGAWEERSRASIGFNQQQHHSPPVLSELTAHLQRELLNRFGSRLATRSPPPTRKKGLPGNDRPCGTAFAGFPARAVCQSRPPQARRKPPGSERRTLH